MQIIEKYSSATLSRRWQEACSFGQKERAQSYWIRDSKDVVNIVWLNSDGIRDITLSPSSDESLFNFVPLKSITTFEIHEKKDVMLSRLQVKGDFVVKVIIGAGQRGNIWWVAENEISATRLRAFLASVLASYAKKQ